MAEQVWTHATVDILSKNPGTIAGLGVNLLNVHAVRTKIPP